MDRALNPADLADALGEHTPGVLPSVEELTDLIADVEVRAFIGPTIIDDRLLQTAWYLHGVASAANAENLYTPIRQRRAFAVSAHIFDIALNEPDRVAHDRLTLAFGAQTGYRRSDLDPNATAIWRRVDALLDDPSGEWSGHDVDAAPPFDTAAFQTMALRAGIAFLGLDVSRVTQLLSRWRSQGSAMASVIGLDSLRSTMFGPAEQVVVAVSELMEFLRYGDRERIQGARDALASVIDLSAGSGDHDARWVAAHLLHVADGLEISSVWSVLPDGTPTAVAQAFTIGAPPILTLWPPQRDLLRRAIMNPLDPATKRLLLSVPTSAGKTLLAQIVICHHLATHTGDVCYVTPLRSLGREMRQALSSRLRLLQKGLGGDLPDFGNVTIEDFLSSVGEPGTGSVEVMTPERLAHLLRRDPARVLDRFSMFVVDEAHLLAQPGRGFLLESLLATLATTSARLILLSGVMGNAQQVATWLDSSEPDVLYGSDWRGPRRLHALLYSKVLWDEEESLATRSKNFPRRLSFPVVGELQVRPAESSVRRLTTSREQPLGVMVRDYRLDGSSQRNSSSTPFYKLSARTADALLQAGSLLMIVSRRDYARNAAQELAGLLETSPNTVELRVFLADRLGEEHPLVDCVQNGVAYHHAGLPVDVLDALEQAMRAEQLLALVATTTLTDGVNLPVRTVLISETRYEGQDPGQQLNAARLLNAVGRAGRAGRETEGWIVLALNQRASSANFDLLRPAADDLEVRSRLDSAAAMQQLAEAEALIATSADALFALAEGEAAEFAAFVWFVLSAQERLQRVSSASDVGRAVRSLLAFVQLPPEIEARWIAFANQVRQRFLDTPESSRLRWTVAGTTLGSARAIETIAYAVAAQITASYGEAPEPGSDVRPVLSLLDMNETLSSLEDAGAFDLLLQLPEAANVWRFKETPGARRTLDVSVVHALRGWMSGLDMPALALHMLPTVLDPSWRLEQTVDAVSNAFEHFLSWTLGVVTDQANELLVDAGGVTAIPEDLSYLVRYGVDTTQALGLLTSGVRSRRLAHQVGQQAEALELEGVEVREWLRQLHVDGWRTAFDATAREIEDLAEFTRSTSESLLRRLLEFGEARAELRYAIDPQPVAPVPVEVRLKSAHEPVELWTLEADRYRVGVVAAAFHADILLVRSSGLEFSASTDGYSVVLRAER